jgi:hypothetical protein
MKPSDRAKAEAQRLGAVACSGRVVGRRRARDWISLARLFAQTSLPYRDPGDVPAWGRRNGNLVLVVQPGMTIDKDGMPRSIGYPFGTVPRLVLTWLSTEAVRTKSRDLVLGESLAEFMRSLELTPTGGRNGTITRLRRQMERLFQATLSARWEGDASRETGGRLNVASSTTCGGRTTILSNLR